MFRKQDQGSTYLYQEPLPEIVFFPLGNAPLRSALSDSAHVPPSLFFPYQ